MNALMIYMVKVAFYITAFYLVYSLMLSRDTSHVRNRAFILLSLVISLSLPLITFQTIKPIEIQFFGKLLTDVFISGTLTGPETTNSDASGAKSLQIIHSIYISGVILFGLKLSIDLLNLLLLIIRRKAIGSNIIKFNGLSTAGFSALGYIFINSSLNREEAGEIIKHEQNHINHYHFVDILFIEITKTFQWFNPFIYLFNRSLRAIHEYQADLGCLMSGVPVENYQSLLFGQVFKTNPFNLTNCFSNPSLIKKRMIMMTRKRSSAFSAMKILLVIPVAGFVFFTIPAKNQIPASTELPALSTVNQQSSLTQSPVSTQIPVPVQPPKEISTEPPASGDEIEAGSSGSQGPESLITPPPAGKPPDIPSEVKEEEYEAPFVVVEEMPMFPGGDSELLKYIAANTQYPSAAKDQNIQGRVIIRFCITAKGGISQVSVLKGVSPELDKEAIRVVNTLPEFKPGRQGGKAVPVWYMVPITFTLR